MVSLIFRIFFIFTLSLYGEIYILSYKVVVKNGIITSDSLYISPLMVSSKKFKYDGFIQLEGEIRDNNKYLIRKNKELILERLFKNGIIINGFSKNHDFASTSQTTILLPPLYVALQRDSLYVNLIILKEIR